MNDDCERSLITHFQVEAHADEQKVNIQLGIQIIGATWLLYEELIDVFRSTDNVEVGSVLKE
jgi:hypothetical protein